jgi:hypothetical protein
MRLPVFVGYFLRIHSIQLFQAACFLFQVDSGLLYHALVGVDWFDGYTRNIASQLENTAYSRVFTSRVGSCAGFAMSPRWLSPAAALRVTELSLGHRTSSPPPSLALAKAKILRGICSYFQVGRLYIVELEICHA